MKKSTLLSEGQLVLANVIEGDYPDNYRMLEFTTPLIIEWSAYEENGDVMVFVDYPFGMDDKFAPYKSITQGWGYEGLTKDTPIGDIVFTFIKYDLFHAFCHYNGDPNYSHLHWALYFALKDQTKIIENYPDL